MKKRQFCLKDANNLYADGRYADALSIYVNQAEYLGYSNLYWNIADVINKISKGECVGAEALELARQGKFNIIQELFAKSVVVSLTSYPARINTVHITIKSLLVQQFKPEKIILWLAKEQFKRLEADLPIDLLSLKNFGLQIEWCEDLKSYKKIIPTLEAYPQKIIVTADDDIVYKPNWLLQLILTHIEFPKAIVCHRAHKIKLLEDGSLAKYKQWRHEVKLSKPSYLNFFTGCGGVLYPVGSLSPKVKDRDLFNKICRTGDDIWLWGMALLNNTKIVRVKNSEFEIELTPGSQESALWVENVNEGGNDKMLQDLILSLPQLTDKLHDSFCDFKESLVSVVIPVFNTGAYLSDCLNSIVQQDYGNIELLCINDGSTDNKTLEILEFFKNKFDFVSVLHQKNSGPATARNFGVSMAKGEYVIFVDSDDFISSNFISSLYYSVKKNNADIAVADRVLNVNDAGDFVRKNTGFEEPNFGDLDKFLANSIITTGVSCNKIYKRKFLIENDIKYLDGMRCPAEDNYFSAVAVILGRDNIAFASGADYFYRQNSSSITKSITEKGAIDSILVYEKLCQDLSRRGFVEGSYWMNVVNMRAQKDLGHNLSQINMSSKYETLLNEKFSLKIDICCIADENYIHPTLVFLESLKNTRKKMTHISVTVITSNDVVDQMQILKMVGEEYFDVSILGVDFSPFSQLHKYNDDGNFCMASPSAMFKFIIPDLFPDKERILYLDTDLIVRKDLSEIYMQTMNDTYLCAVVDLWTPITNRTEAKISSTYFNSGVMMLNLELMRRDKVSSQLIDAKIKSTNFDLMDQDIFNTVCADSVKRLSIKYNFLPVCYKRHKTKFQLEVLNDLYCENYESIEEIADDPVIAHWAGSDKPWKTSETLYASEWIDIYEAALMKYDISRFDFKNKPNSL